VPGQPPDIALGPSCGDCASSLAESGNGRAAVPTSRAARISCSDCSSADAKTPSRSPVTGLKAARRMAERRRGRWFDPALVDAFLSVCGDRDFWAALGSPDVSDWEPADFALAGDDARLDRISEAFARVIDAKSPFTARHSQRVAEVADGMAAVLGFDAAERRTLVRAGLLHDIGKLAISSRILDKPGKLTDEEFRAVQTHPVHTLRILERAPCFAPLADLAANHHEKLDGSGYPRSLDARHLDLPMRVLAVADIYEALTADRPYRGPMPVEEALAIIGRDVPHKLDDDARAALETHVGQSLASPADTPVRTEELPATDQPTANGVARDILLQTAA
jgi:HD-GYP domain-containing protein (c-di-GMP phosphodiesterase class II)